ncbi:TolC family protein [Bdellovibrio sp. NC01]|uniref:TolC family protein n=1 Tax=Bdellovibrio sp. NC01 TaxID=2220073 RepID=UPI001156D7D4|nr:TolC family protein [Bdellovibrio sp. NC01]QDK37160.1 TolC family protein [Bdellovibrio sp. NC01]
MFPRKSSFLFTLTSLAISFANAQEVYTFQQAVDLVKQNNADIRSSEQNLQSSKFTIDSYRGTYYPQLSGSLGYSQTGPNDPDNGSTGGSSYSATLNASQNIFNGFADVAKVDSAKAQARVSEASLAITKAKASYDLKVAYAYLLYAKDAEKITKDFLKRREDNLRMVELRFESGRENKGSLMLSQAYLLQSKSDLLKAAHGRETSESDLQKVLGLDGDRVVDVKDDIPLREPADKDPDYQQIAMTTPTRLQSVAQVDVSEASVTSAKSSFFPTLNLTGSVGKLDEQFFPDNDRWAVGATLSVPLFNGGRDYYSTKSATSSLYAAKSNLTSVERSLLSTLKKAFTSYQEAVADLKVNEAFLSAAKTRAEIARSKYNNGLLTFDDWDIIENDLITKTKTYLQSKRDRIVAEAAWEQAQGTGAIQ